MTAYYNEIDPFAAAWLRELIRGGHIAPGDVDERSIADVRATDLVGYQQVHFFAGIGGWSLALRLAGIPDDAEVWTGSCPCQPFSVAGKGRGTDDERHLWPEMRRLVAERLPPAVLGEQVASRPGRDWLAAVRSDLEDVGYAVGAADLCAAGVGAPHIRQRLFWGGIREWGGVRGRGGDPGRARGVGSNGVADSNCEPGGQGRPVKRRGDPRGHAQPWPRPWSSGSVGGLLDTPGYRLEHGRVAGDGASASRGGTPGVYRDAGETFWTNVEWIPCVDGVRPVEPGVRPLVDGVPRDVGGVRKGQFRGYGNAIVPRAAAVFARAVIG